MEAKASRDTSRAALLQRRRRRNVVRIDYKPSAQALAALEAHRADRPRNSVHATNSAVLNAIVTDWAELVGLPVPALAAGTEAGEVRALAIDKVSVEIKRPAISTPRVICGATRHRDRQPCQAKSEPGKRRCRFHGGRSTGPRTPEGKARCAANLPSRAKGRAGG